MSLNCRRLLSRLMTPLIRTNRCIDSIETRRIFTSLDKRDRYG